MNESRCVLFVPVVLSALGCSGGTRGAFMATGNGDADDAGASSGGGFTGFADAGGALQAHIQVNGTGLPCGRCAVLVAQATGGQEPYTYRWSDPSLSGPGPRRCARCKPPSTRSSSPTRAARPRARSSTPRRRPRRQPTSPANRPRQTRETVPPTNLSAASARRTRSPNRAPSTRGAMRPRCIRNASCSTPRPARPTSSTGIRSADHRGDRGHGRRLRRELEVWRRPEALHPDPRRSVAPGLLLRAERLVHVQHLGRAHRGDPLELRPLGQWHRLRGMHRRGHAVGPFRAPSLCVPRADRPNRPNGAFQALRFGISISRPASSRSCILAGPHAVVVALRCLGLVSPAPELRDFLAGVLGLEGDGQQPRRRWGARCRRWVQWKFQRRIRREQRGHGREFRRRGGRRRDAQSADSGSTATGVVYPQPGQRHRDRACCLRPRRHVTDEGTLVYDNPAIARDLGFSGVVNGQIVWTFGDTLLSTSGGGSTFCSSDSAALGDLSHPLERARQEPRLERVPAGVDPADRRRAVERRAGPVRRRGHQRRRVRARTRGSSGFSRTTAAAARTTSSAPGSRP